jgi:hypothetical protein
MFESKDVLPMVGMALSRKLDVTMLQHLQMVVDIKRSKPCLKRVML